MFLDLFTFILFFYFFDKTLIYSLIIKYMHPEILFDKVPISLNYYSYYILKVCFLIVCLRGVYFDACRRIRPSFGLLRNRIFLLHYVLGCLCSAVKNGFSRYKCVYMDLCLQEGICPSLFVGVAVHC